MACLTKSPTLSHSVKIGYIGRTIRNTLNAFGACYFKSIKCLSISELDFKEKQVQYTSSGAASIWRSLDSQADAPQHIPAAYLTCLTLLSVRLTHMR